MTSAGETRDAERHQEKAEKLPPVKAGGGSGSGGAEVKGKPDDRAQAERGQPQARVRDKVAEEHDQIPKEITPKDLTRGIERSEVTEQGS